MQSSLILVPYLVYSPRLNPGEHARYRGSTLIHQLGLSALAIIVLTLGGVILSIGIGPQGLAPVVWTLVVVSTFISLRDYIRQISFANLCFNKALILDLGVSALQLFGIILLTSLGLISAKMAYWVIGLSCGLASLGWIVWMRQAFAPQIAQSISDLVVNWKLGKWVFASGLLLILSMVLYPWVLAFFHGIASNGVWGACFGIAAICNPLLLAMQSFLGPKLSHSYAESGGMGLRRFLFKACAVSSLVLTPLCVLLFSFGGSLVVVVYGDKYAGNGLLVSILALNLMVLNISFSLSKTLIVMEHAKVEFAANFVALFVLLMLGVWLIKYFGPVGMAFGILAGNITFSVVGYLFFSKLVNLNNGK